MVSSSLEDSTLATTQKIPVIDLSRAKTFHDPDTALALGRGLKQFGFVVITGHDVPKQLLADAYEVTKKTFALPTRTKMRYATPGNGYMTGYAPFGQEHAKGYTEGDLKEFWHFRKHVSDRERMMPDEVARFKRTILRLYNVLEQQAYHLLVYLDYYLNHRRENSRKQYNTAGMISNGHSLLRLLHYPTIHTPSTAMRSAPHEDINLITLLPAATGAGLQCKARNGEWIAIDNPPDAIIVNSGDMLQAHTNGWIPSTTHCVVNGDGTERYSMPFFVHPRQEVVLVEKPRLTAHQYLHQRLTEIGLMKSLPIFDARTAN